MVNWKEMEAAYMARVIVSVMEVKVFGGIGTYTIGEDVPEEVIEREKIRTRGDVSSLELFIGEVVRSVVQNRIRAGNTPMSHSFQVIG